MLANGALRWSIAVLSTVQHFCHGWVFVLHRLSRLFAVRGFVLPGRFGREFGRGGAFVKGASALEAFVREPYVRHTVCCTRQNFVIIISVLET